jgi:hypothetical protein
LTFMIGDVTSTRARFSAKNCGALGVGTFVAAFAVLGVCQWIFKNDQNLCLVPYILLHLLTIAFSSGAAVRGSKWWLVPAALSACLAAQGLLGLFVE